MKRKQQQKHFTLGLFEDNPIVSVGLTCYFEKQKDFSITLQFTSSDPKEFINNWKSNQPDILIIDIISDQTFGLELFEKVLSQKENTKVIAYTNVKSKQIIKTLFSMGIDGYIPKKEDLYFLDEALDIVLNQQKVYLPPYLKSLFKEKKEITVLTEMEKKIIPYLLEGNSSREIAEEFFVTNSAIDFHKKNLFIKFKVNNIASFVKEAIAQGYSRGINF